jgi:hypothetical protein
MLAETRTRAPRPSNEYTMLAYAFGILERNHQGKSNVLPCCSRGSRKHAGRGLCDVVSGRPAPALLPSGRRLNWRVRSADDREVAIRWLSGGCHVKLTVGKIRERRRGFRGYR